MRVVELKINAKGMLKRLEKREDREKTSLYLSRAIYQEFKKVTGTIAPSVVIEELMQMFLESHRKSAKQKDH
jgi:hypothetical protein